MAEISVLHSRRAWLPLTEAWLYDQIRSLPPDISSHVVCERLENPRSFAEVALTCLGNRPELRFEKLLRRVGLLKYLPAHARVARRTRAQILHSHFGDAGWRDADLASALELAHIVTFYGLDVNYLPRQDPTWIVRYGMLFERAAAILCEGPHMARCLEALGCPADKIRVHHLGVNVAEIPHQLRERRPDQPLKVLIAGSFREKKGIPDAIRALAKVSSHIPLHVTLVGEALPDARSRREERRIDETIAVSGIAKRVQRRGFVPREVLRQIALEHDVFLAPSVTAADGDTEGGAPITILEMMATGMPVVSTTHCDIPELLDHGVTGLLAPEHDVDALAAHLCHLADHPGQGVALGRAALAKVEIDFDTQIQGQRLAGIYREFV